MASYRDKINQKQMETESGKIAWSIIFIERESWSLMKEEYRNLRTGGIIDLFDGYSLWESKDCGVYVISKPVEYKGNRYWRKYVQQGMYYDEMVRMLDAQPWDYI